MRRGGRSHSSPCAGAEPLPKVTPGQILAGGATARQGGGVPGTPLALLGVLHHGGAHDGGKALPAQGTQNPPYPLPRSWGG